MRKGILVLQLMLLTQFVAGQIAAFQNNSSTSEAFLRKIVPPSPTAASLGKYGDQQINMFSGTASVNIPIYEIKANSISIPLSLSYSSSGLKVTEAASWVGLGWTLNGMGVVTRVVRGSADFAGSKDYFNIRTFPLPLTYSRTSNSAWGYLLANLDNNNFDPEPDLYIVHAAGLSLKFYYDRYKRIQTIPYNNSIKIKYDNTNQQYVITDDSGNTYYFGGSNANETSYPEGAASYISSWYLTKISSSEGNEINLSYTVGSNFILQDQFTETEEVKVIGSTGLCASPTASGDVRQFNKQSIRPCFLNNIQTDNEIVYFIRDVSERADQPGDYALKEIKVYSRSSGKYINNYNFTYSYFPQVSQLCWGEQNSFPAHTHDHAAVCKRLRLDNFAEKGLEGNTSGFKTYQFQYSNKAVPARCSLDQDHWGYYNGANNMSLLPKVSDVNFQSSTNNAQSREASASFGDAGLLQRVIYPTGGETNFEYEPNEVKTYVATDTWQTTIVSLSGITPSLEATATFTLNSQQTAYIKYTLDDPNLIDQGLQRKVEIIDQAGVTKFSCFNLSTGNNYVSATTFGLPAGTYTLKISRNYAYSSYPSVPPQAITASVMYNPQVASSNITRTIGGFRIKKIYDKSSLTDVGTHVKEFIYENPYLIADIGSDDYKVQYKRGFVYCSGGTGSSCQTYECYFISRNSSSVQPLGSIQGSHIGYGKVTTLSGSNGGNGKTVSFFSVDPDAGGYSLVPITRPVTSYDHRRGNLLQQIDYNSSGNILRLISNNYENILKYDGNFSTPFYVKNNPVPPGEGTNPDGAPYKQVAFIDFALPSEWVRVKNSCETIFSGSNYISTIKEFGYNNPNYPYVTTTKTSNSKGNSLEEVSTYPLDYKPATTASNEQIERKFEADYQSIFNTFFSCTSNATTSSATDACYTSYQSSYDNLINTRATALINYLNNFTSIANATGDPILKGEYSLLGKNKLTAIIDKTVIQNGSIELSKVSNNYTDFNGDILLQKVNKSVLTNSLETEITFNAYHSNGNILQATSKNGIINSYLWDYHASYPVAKIINGANTAAAYTSFEADGFGNFDLYSGTISTAVLSTDMPPTGNKYYNLASGSPLQKSQVAVGTNYIISYWSKNGSYFIEGGTALGSYQTGRIINGWTYYEHKITTTSTAITITGTGSIDEVRIYPSSAQMITYTYEPLVGTTSECDVNNRIIYYEYDVFNRLNLIKDQDRNIIKKFCYNYSGQQVNCDGIVYGNVLKQQTFTRNNCGSGYIGGSAIYTVNAGTYKSVISQADADQQAQNDINTNGQNYANANGTCTAPPNIDVTYTNGTNATVYLELTNTISSITYYYTLNANITTSTIALQNGKTAAQSQIPQGTYNAYMYSNTGAPYRYRVYNYTQSGVTTFQASNVSLCAACASVSINNYP